MLAGKYWPIVWKQVARARIRSALTLCGVATAMFLFLGVQAMHDGVRAATQSTAEDATLVVYRQNRFCPFSSRLPEDYARKIESIPGVRSVVPMRILVNNCRASLDVVTFRGVPQEKFEAELGPHITMREGSIADWRKRTDAALLGSRLADRRGLKPGDTLTVAGITVQVAGVYDSERAQDQNVAYTHLPFVQRAASGNLGIVTQFNVTVDDPAQLDAIAALIDDEFRSAQDPTQTWNEKAFTARAVTDIIEIVNFARWLGWGALAAVFALVANAIILAVQERVRDHAVLQTLGYSSGLIARLIVAEGVLVSLAGGVLGLLAAVVVLRLGAFSFSVEGLSVNIGATGGTIVAGLALCGAIGVLAGLVPAIQAARRPIAGCFRAV